MSGKGRTRSGAQNAAGVRWSWKTFLKIKLDYYMGYDRNWETNLTKEKKWDLIYTH